MKRHILLPLAVLALLVASCSRPSVPTQFKEGNRLPEIYPEYADVTIPVNIAPLCFELRNPHENVVTRLSGADKEIVCEGQKVMPDMDEWKELLAQTKGDKILVEVYTQDKGTWTRHKPFHFFVSADSIDPYLTYRLISPSYVTYEELTINQRCLENFEESVIYNNMLCSTEKDGQCINCHHSQNWNPNRTQFHARQAHGGTIINMDGKLFKTNMKSDSTISAGVYPSWHPTLNLIAYSTNNTGQSFHTRDLNKIEVLDSHSDLILYDIDKNEVTNIENDPNEFEIFPCWSPDGKWLYYCSAHFEYSDTMAQETENILRYKEIKYSVYRKSFDEKTFEFGPREMVLDAAGQGLSATIPRISPDGRWLLLSVGEWGCFHIWHRDADLWLVDLRTMEPRPFTEVNSDNVEAYHTWCHTGRWIVFSSRREDGNYTRPFFAHVDADGHATKPFELPCADPDYHRQMMKSYNIPEFLTGPVTITPQTFADKLKEDAVPASFVSKYAGK